MYNRKAFFSYTTIKILVKLKIIYILTLKRVVFIFLDLSLTLKR